MFKVKLVVDESKCQWIPCLVIIISFIKFTIESFIGIVLKLFVTVATALTRNLQLFLSSSSHAESAKE